MLDRQKPSSAGKRGSAESRRPSARWKLPLAAAVLGCGLNGCANLWDDVTSREFSLRTMFVRTEPLEVLKDSHDGDERAKALRALREPKRNGGSDGDQDMILALLTTAARAETQPLCRLAAIQSLSGFQDPRAVAALRDAFYAADQFPAETATLVRCHALTALGETKNPAAVDLLAKVVKEPPREGSEQERQQAVDVRIAAARALANFNHYQGTEALVAVLKADREDVALRASAHASLQTCTGKKLPPDGKSWEDLLRNANASTPPVEPSPIRRVAEWLTPEW